jgi:DHA1 family multidrug resistance protein-like MFS transporter
MSMPFERRVLIAMCVLIFANQLGFGAMVPAMPIYAETYGVSATAIGMAIAVYGLARFVLAMPSGWLSDNWGRQPALAIGGVLSASGNFWSVFADAYPEFMAARFVAGAGAGMVVTTGAVVLADITTAERRGRVMAIYQGTFIFAVGVGPMVGGPLADYYGLAAPFWFCGGASLIASTVALLAVKETRHLARSKENKDTPRPTFGAQIVLLSRNIGFVLVSGIALINALTRTGGLFNIIPIIGSFKLGLSVSEIGYGMGVGSVLGLLATYPSGMIADRWGRKAVIVPVTVLTGASFLLFMIAGGFLVFASAYVLWGVASSIGGSAPAAYAADSAPPGMNASAMSMFRMLGDIGYVVGPIALGFIVDVSGTDVALILSAVLLVMIGAAFAKFAPETYRAR